MRSLLIVAILLASPAAWAEDGFPAQVARAKLERAAHVCLVYDQHLAGCDRIARAWTAAKSADQARERPDAQRDVDAALAVMAR